MIKKGLPFALLLAGSVQAQVMDEIILLKDGTELQGSIIEQDYTRGRYIVRLNDGGTVAVKKKSVKSIRRVVSDRQPEPVAESTYNNFNQLPATSAGSQAVTYIPLPEDVAVERNTPSRSSSSSKNHRLALGYAMRSIVQSDGDGSMFSGFSANYEYSFTKSVSVYATYFQTELASLIVNGESSTLPNNLPELTGYQLALSFGKVSGKGLRFFGGIGAFQDTITEADNSTYEASGLSLHGGAGYRWDAVEATYRLTLDNSSDYEDRTGFSGNLQLGFVF